MTDRETMKMAFNALLLAAHTTRITTVLAMCAQATDAIRDALAQPEQNHEPSWQAGFAEGKQAAMNQFIRDECDKRSRPYQEPVAYVTGTYGGHFAVKPTNPAMALPAGKALYSAPPKREWVGLTIDESSALYNKNYDLYATDMPIGDFIMIQREVEAKLKEKNFGS